MTRELPLLLLFALDTAKKINIHRKTISKTATEDLGMKPYAMRTAQLLTDAMKETCKLKAAALLNNLKHETAGLLRFFSKEKNFDQDQKSEETITEYVEGQRMYPLSCTLSSMLLL